jgi:hypothetical protein
LNDFPNPILIVTVSSQGDEDCWNPAGDSPYVLVIFGSDRLGMGVLLQKLKPVFPPLLRLGCQDFIYRAGLMAAKHWHGLMLYSLL